MPQFFISSSDITDGNILITGNDSHHLVNVRRIRPGDTVMLRGDNGKGYVAEIKKIAPDGVHASVIREVDSSADTPDITLYMALLKGGNFEFVIQKAVEIGVNRIVPVVTERTVPDPGRMSDKKIERWNRIAEEAGKQCFRKTPAYVESPVLFKTAITEDLNGLKIICHPGADIQMKECLEFSPDRHRASLLIGPEGGFSEKEISSASGAGWHAVNLGANHLRAETAALVLPSIVIYEWSTM